MLVTFDTNVHVVTKWNCVVPSVRNGSGARFETWVRHTKRPALFFHLFPEAGMSTCSDKVFPCQCKGSVPHQHRPLSQAAESVNEGCQFKTPEARPLAYVLSLIFWMVHNFFKGLKVIYKVI
jgi:hypothetical protein